MSEGFNQFRKQLSSGLQKKRWSLKSVTALVLFGAIIMVFALFGLPNQMNGGGQMMGAAAQVNDTLISIADLRSESARLEQMYAPLFGGNMAEAQRQFVQQQALENLIVQELAMQRARKEGIRATDVELQEMIVKELPYFQRDGRFQRELYYQILQANGMTPADFEQKLRKEKINLRTQKLFEATSQPLKFELAKLKTLQETKMNVAFARVTKEKVVSEMKPASAQARLSDPAFAQKVQEYYNANRAEFAIEPQARAQHILIKIDEDTNEVQAREKIEALRKQAQSGDFSALAKKNSEDEGSKAKGGDLGFFTKGKMVPEFERAAFTQKIGEVGEPIRSPFGFHIVKVLERKEGGERPLEQVRTEIAQKLVATETYESEMQALEAALAKNDNAAVDAQLKKLGIQWDETGFFDLNADMIPKLQSPEASRVAFTLNPNQPMHPKIVADGPERFVLRLKGTKTEAAPASANLQDMVARERAGDLFRTWIEAAKENADIERNPQVVSGRQ